MSQVYETEPMGGPDDQGAYLNMVVEIETTLDPFALLRRCQRIEAEAMRQRVVHWGPRTLEPPGFAFVQAVTRRPGVVTREALAARWSRATGIDVGGLDYYLVFAFWRLASIVEGAHVLRTQGLVDSEYSRKLEYDVPALLEEAAQVAGIRSA
jgi:aminoglycoside phosphotransferase (APT) family kinase protein